MPELPEVETIIKYLSPQIIDRQIVGVTITPKGERHFNKSKQEAIELLTGSKFQGLKRHGKWMLFELDSSPVVAHLRMSGLYEVSDEPLDDNPHTRFYLELDNGKVVNYIDQRRFGTFHFTESIPEYLEERKLGPDALSSDFNPEQLYEAISERKKSIYSTLLDQSVVAGLGNIYVNEVLHLVGLHPLTPSDKLTIEDNENIVREAKDILNLALKFKGTTLVDNLYRNPEGGSGEFYKLLKVYGKKKDPDIEIIKVGGRSVFVHKSQILKG